MFERYTESARRSLFFSRYEASQLGSITIDAEHLLLGLTRDPASLRGLLSVPLEQLRREIAAGVTFKEKLSTSVEIPFSPEAKRVLQFAAAEADGLGHGHIGNEHLLLGLLREDHSKTASVLVAQGARLGDLRKQVAALPVPAEPASQPPATIDVHLDRIKIDRVRAWVEELARTPRGTREAEELLARINAALDALPGGDGIR